MTGLGHCNSTVVRRLGQEGRVRTDGPLLLAFFFRLQPLDLHCRRSNSMREQPTSLAASSSTSSLNTRTTSANSRSGRNLSSKCRPPDPLTHSSPAGSRSTRYPTSRCSNKSFVAYCVDMPHDALEAFIGDHAAAGRLKEVVLRATSGLDRKDELLLKSFCTERGIQCTLPAVAENDSGSGVGEVLAPSRGAEHRKSGTTARDDLAFQRRAQDVRRERWVAVAGIVVSVFALLLAELGYIQF